MYEAVHAGSGDGHTVEALASTAEAYGYEGVVVRSCEDGSTGSLDDVAAATGVDVVDGVEVRADDPARAGGAVGNVRSSHTVVAVRGGSPEMNRFAVGNDKVDVLTRPMTGSGDVNHVLAKEAAANGVRLEFNLSGVLRTNGGSRVRTIQGLQKLHEIVSYYDAPYVVSADADSRYRLRAPRELAALGEQLGLSGEWIERGLAEWGHLANKNRRVRSRSYVEPGVERRGPGERTEGGEVDDA